MNQANQKTQLRKAQIAQFKESLTLSELDARMSIAKTTLIENEFKQMDYYLKARAIKDVYLQAINEDRASYLEAQKKAEEEENQEPKDTQEVEKEPIAQ